MTDKEISVLLLEDNLALGQMVQEGLRRGGYTNVRHVTGIQDGMHALEDDTFDVAVLDLWIGGKLSESVVAEVRRQAIPAVLTSGDTVHDELSVHPERYVFLRKPFSPDALIAAITEITG